MKNISLVNKTIENYLLSLETGIYKYKDLLEKPKKHNKHYESFIKLKNKFSEKEFQMYLRNKICDLKKNNKILKKDAFIVIDKKNDFDRFLNIYMDFVENNKMKSSENICFYLDTLIYMNQGNGILNKKSLYVSESYLEKENLKLIKPIIKFFYKNITIVKENNVIEHSVKEFMSNKVVNKENINIFNKFTKINDIYPFEIFRKNLTNLSEKKLTLFAKNLKFLEKIKC